MPWAFLMGQGVKNPPTNGIYEVASLGRVGPLEKEMGAQSSILAWEIPWTEEPDRLQFMELQKSRTRLRH